MNKELLEAYIALHAIYYNKRITIAIARDTLSIDTHIEIIADTHTNLALIIDGIDEAMEQLNDAICFQQPIDEEWVTTEIKNYKLI